MLLYTFYPINKKCYENVMCLLGTRGSEIKARDTEMAKKAETEEKTESNRNKFAAIA